MPLRYTPSGAALQPLTRVRVLLSPLIHTKPFHASRVLRDDGEDSGTPQNHYETLNVHPDASAAEIKKSFYTLSKRHHPDHNPSDPHAPHRFMRISEAYGILSHADKRTHYDTHVLRRGHSRTTPHGSYHSTHPAGGRPASGLSRRRGTFTGPPPSFFRSGGWGAHGSKRRAAHEESTGSSGTNTGNPEGQNTGAGFGHDPSKNHGSGAGGMGPGQRPYGQRRTDDEVPHFDREGHERTQRRYDARRARRREMAHGLNPFGTEPSSVANFMIVSAVLLIATFGPYLVLGMWQTGNERKPKQRPQHRGTA